MNVNLIDVGAMSHGAKAAVQCQKEYFNTNITKSFAWRLEQLDRLSRMLSENMNAFSDAVGRDFKTALSEKIFEVAALIGLVERTKANLKAWMAPVVVPVPTFLRESGHKAMVYREPYGVSLIMGPFNGPLLLLMRPAITALAAGNTCIRAIAPVGPHRQRSAVCKLPSASWEAWARTAHRTRHRSRRVDAEC